MSAKIFERYSSRVVSNLGLWEIEGVEYKIYGITADNKKITERIINDARMFAQKDVAPVVTSEGESNELGYIIIHPGDLGVSILVHWWIQGSVLCQQIKRTLWGSDIPMDTATRPVIACVWELEVINAEQLIWKQTMMNNEPSRSAYLNTRISDRQI